MASKQHYLNIGYPHHAIPGQKGASLASCGLMLSRMYVFMQIRQAHECKMQIVSLHWKVHMLVTA